MPDIREGIWADVMVVVKDPRHRTLPDEQLATRPHKVRVTIFSGPDFRTPSITGGRVFSNRPDAEAVANQACAALDLLLIPRCAERGRYQESPRSLLHEVTEGGFDRV